jgi:hypothetical protein
MVMICYLLAQPKAERPPLVGYPQLLIEYIYSYPPIWRKICPAVVKGAHFIKGIVNMGYIMSTYSYICLSIGLVQSKPRSANTFLNSHNTRIHAELSEPWWFWKNMYGAYCTLD